MSYLVKDRGTGTESIPTAQKLLESAKRNRRRFTGARLKLEITRRLRFVGEIEKLQRQARTFRKNGESVLKATTRDSEDITTDMKNPHDLTCHGKVFTYPTKHQPELGSGNISCNELKSAWHFYQTSEVIKNFVQ